MSEAKFWRLLERQFVVIVTFVIFLVVENSSDKMSLEEAALFLGVTKMTVRRRMDAGEIKPLPKPPGAIRNPKLYFLKSDVEKLVKK